MGGSNSIVVLRQFLFGNWLYHFLHTICYTYLHVLPGTYLRTDSAFSIVTVVSMKALTLLFYS